jgi:drug/metabolite transporter (DMT)-like permease
MGTVVCKPISRPTAIAAMLGSAACWGGATAMTKGALDTFGPFMLLTIQLLSSVAVLWLATLLARVQLPSLGVVARTSATGLLEPGLAYAVGVPGLVLTTASNATVIASLEPVFILLLAWLLFGTTMRAYSILAVFLSVIGVAMVSLTGPSIGLSSGFVGPRSYLGDGLILLGTLFAAMYVIASSRLTLTMPAILLTALQQTAGVCLVFALLAVALGLGWERWPTDTNTPMLSLAIGSGVIQYALAFWLYILGLKGIPAGMAGLFLTTTPVFGVIGGIAFLGEQITLLQFAGIGLVIFGLCFVLWLEPSI